MRIGRWARSKVGNRDLERGPRLPLANPSKAHPMQVMLPPPDATLSTGLLGTPTGELVLQICGGEHDGRLLRLNAAKCLVGSAPGCTLRLRARGVRPVHALILRGPAGALVRCWSPDAQLNERAFTEAALRIGDRLQLGTVSLAVVELAESVPAPESAFRALPQEGAPVAEETEPRPRPRSRERRRQLFEQLRRGRENQSTLQSTLASRQEQLQALESQIEQLQAAAAQAAELPAVAIPAPANDILHQQLAQTIQQLQQELEAAAKRRVLEQQTATRQRIAAEEQAEERLQQQLAAARQELQAKFEQQLAAATTELTTAHRARLTVMEQEQTVARRNLQALQDALAAKAKSEEQTRTTLAAQLEQVNAAFGLVRQERDELFEQLHSDQQTSDRQNAKWQAQIDEVRRQAQAQVNEAQAAAQRQLFQLREDFAARERQWDEELLARTKAEAERRADDAERMTRLTAEYEAHRTEATAAAAANRQQQEGFTQARKRLEAEIATLNARLQQSEQALHDVRENSGQVQAAVLADAEQARAQRDAVREQMLRQQQDWTEFRSRLESAAAAERDLAQARFSALEVELIARNEATLQVQAECSELERQLEKFKTDLEQSQAALLASESNLSQRVQQLTAEGEQTQSRLTELTAQLEAAQADAAQVQAARVQLVQLVESLRIELEQSQEALYAAENGASQRLQQMTVSMEQLQLDRGGADAQYESERAEWDREREGLAQCVADLQQQVTDLTANLQALEQQAHQVTLEAAAQAETSQQQLQLAQEQLNLWQAAAEQARGQAEQLMSSVARFQEQEQIWQREREQLDQLQLDSTSRLQQLESSITNLQQQLDEAQQAVAVTCPQPARTGLSPEPENVNRTVNVNNQELAALHEQRFDLGAENISGTINVNNQDLAALHEQLNGPPSLLAPRPVLDAAQLALLQDREAALQEQAEHLAAQQAQLEEEQSTVARQRIELEQFQASLVELERSLTARAESLLQQSTPANAPPAPEAAHDHYGDNYYGEVERDSNPLSESEAFAAMADQVANLYRAPEVASDLVHAAAAEEQLSYAAPDASVVPEQPYIPESPRPEIDERIVEEPGEESLIIATPAAGEPERVEPLLGHEPSETGEQLQADADSSLIHEPSIIAPEGEEDFDRQLDARIARVMRRETTSWSEVAAPENDAPVESPREALFASNPSSEVPPPSQSQAVSSVLDRLREAGLWKGEGTAKADQVPSSAPPLDEGGPGLCRLSQEGPVGHEPAAEETAEPAPPPRNEEADELSRLALSRPAPASLLNPPANEQSEADDSIESYMSRLMARLKTDPEEPRKSAGRTDTRTSRQTTSPPPPPPPKPTDSRPLTSLTELAPRSQAPELNANLAAMRELANSAARNAIETHQQKSGKQRVNMRTINTLMALLVCSGLLYYWTRTGSLIAMGGTGLSLLWAVGSSLVATLQSLQLRQAGKAAEETPPSE